MRLMVNKNFVSKYKYPIPYCAIIFDKKRKMSKRDCISFQNECFDFDFIFMSLQNMKR